ncbi:hypothetical protein ACHAXR_009293 [Thalassiosira sp. AJA248-18]
MNPCSICREHGTRLPNRPYAPRRKASSARAASRRKASTVHKGSGLAVATMTCLVLLSTPICTMATPRAMTGANNAVVGATGLKHFKADKVRLLEGEEELAFIDVGAALAAADNDGGDVAHSSHDGHLFDGDVHDEEHHDEEHHDEEHHDEEHHDEEHHDHDEEHHDEEHHDDEHHDEEHHDEFHTADFHSDSHEEDKPKPWGYVILSTLIVNFASLSGLALFLTPAIYRSYLKFQGLDPQGADNMGRFFDVCVPAFAVGALMSTAFFLVLPEALHLIEGKHSDEGDAHDDHSDHRFLEGEDGHDDHGAEHSEKGHSDGHDDHDDSSESLTAAKFGVAVLGGFLLPMLFGMVFHRHGHSPNDKEHAAQLMSDVGATDIAISNPRENKDGKMSVVTGDDNDCDCCSKEDVETGVVVREVVGPLPETIVLTPAPGAKNESQEEIVNSEEIPSPEPLPSQTAIDYSLIAAVVVGDSFCNFVDGLFIGAAFLSCSWGTTLSILMVTVFHELPQEMADFLLLTRYAGLSTLKACVVNFSTGLIVTLGGLVVLVGSPSDEIVGVILAMAGGGYINIAACETVPRMEKHLYSLADRAAMVFSFIVGTVPIGLVLLKHEHY